MIYYRRKNHQKWVEMNKNSVFYDKFYICFTKKIKIFSKYEIKSYNYAFGSSVYDLIWFTPIGALSKLSVAVDIVSTCSKRPFPYRKTQSMKRSAPSLKRHHCFLAFFIFIFWFWHPYIPYISKIKTAHMRIFDIIIFFGVFE